jgi:hypothetical protein
MKNLYTYDSNNLKWDKVNFSKIITPYITIILVLIFTTIGACIIGINLTKENYRLNKLIYLKNNEINNLDGIIEIINESESFDEINLRLILEGLNIKFIDIAIAQSKLETGNYKSDIFLETGNLFGMKPARLRPYTHYGEHRGHADYKGSWKLSVIDYALWQAREAKNVKTEEQYYFLLSKMYAEDPDYINKLKNIVNKIN